MVLVAPVRVYGRKTAFFPGPYDAKFLKPIPPTTEPAYPIPVMEGTRPYPSSLNDEFCRHLRYSLRISVKVQIPPNTREKRTVDEIEEKCVWRNGRGPGLVSTTLGSIGKPYD